jgi:tRNA pseudouridine65 synthase
MNKPPPLILHRDEDLLVVSKPSGMLVHKGWAKDGETLIDALRQLGYSRLHTVHRLDRATSGIICLALNPDAARNLSEQFAERQVTKRYLALVRGVVKDSVFVDHPIPKEPGKERVPAQTQIDVLASAKTLPRETSLVCAQPLSGRTHQIRRHLKHLNHPIIGDVNYGRGELNRAARERYGLHRLALHALSLTLCDPRSGQMITFSAQLPEDLSLPLIAMGYDSAIVEAAMKRCP